MVKTFFTFIHLLLYIIYLLLSAYILYIFKVSYLCSKLFPCLRIYLVMGYLWWFEKVPVLPYLSCDSFI